MTNTKTTRVDRLNHIIYYEWFLDIRGGGPTGYLANLLDGLNRVSNNENPLILFDNDVKVPAQINAPISRIHALAHRLFFHNERTKKFYINYISKYQRNTHNAYVEFLKEYNNMYCRQDLFDKINIDSTKTIHVHNVGDAVKVKNSLRRLHRNDIKLILTCHTPEAPSNEYYKGYLEQGYNQTRASEIKKGWEMVEKKAFEYSDILVFPSKEAMEPLQQTMENFTKIIQGKDIRFIATGAKRLQSLLTRKEAKEKYGVADKFVVGYVGRHNEVKGYDILKEAASLIIEKRNNIFFLVGGEQGKTFSPLSHEQWIEAGWVNPADLFKAIDVFVLPNRMTYYDLVLLEVMSMGVPVIASSTGGNKSVQNLTNVLTLYNNSAEDLANKIVEFSDLSNDEKHKISINTKMAYEDNFTPIMFAERYKNLINQIYSDYHYI